MKFKLELWLEQHHSTQTLVRTRFRKSKRKLALKRILQKLKQEFDQG